MCRIKEYWVNTSNWNIGDEVDITDPWILIEQGKVVLINDKKEEVVPPGTVMKCPICVYTAEDAFVYARHILTHSKTTQDRVDSIVKDMEKKEEVEKPKRTPEELKAMRVENLHKAREAKLAKV